MIRELLLIGLSLLPFILGGTPCPPRADIYPCVCTQVPMSKKAQFTIVICRGVPHTSILDKAYESFHLMEIDRLVLADCYLEAEKFGKESDRHQKLPSDWWTNLRIRELEILDSVLSSGFACEATGNCQNSHQAHISIVNSSFTPSIQTVCEISRNNKFSWVGCLARLKRFEFTGNKLSALERTFFPVVMQHLEVVNMSRNAIHTLDTEVFKNLPNLTKLDLSHNAIKRLPIRIFGNGASQLKVLDLSFNLLTILPADVHLHTPGLKTLNLRRNLIQKLGENDWKDMPNKQKLRIIDLRENLIYCDCYLKWFNGSLHMNTVVLGTCSTPKQYTNTPIRRASKLLSSKCNTTEESIIK